MNYFLSKSLSTHCPPHSLYTEDLEEMFSRRQKNLKEKDLNLQSEEPGGFCTHDLVVMWFGENHLHILSLRFLISKTETGKTFIS